jgi:Holin of 3TMs, for gene-transfer release
MANDDEIATGHNAKVEDDDFVPNPNKVRSSSSNQTNVTNTPAQQNNLPVYDDHPAPPAATQPSIPQPVAPPPPPPPPPPAPSVTVVDVNNNTGGGMGQAAFMQTQATAQAQAQASVGLAQTNIDEKIVDEQMKKEDEHWMKSFWRPAMGWLYMIICFMDFIGFPILSMFLPVFFKGIGVQVNYVPWQSLTLSNGGLIHLAFGAILGVTSFMRGQEKLATIK